MCWAPATGQIKVPDNKSKIVGQSSPEETWSIALHGLTGGGNLNN